MIQINSRHARSYGFGGFEVIPEHATQSFSSGVYNTIWIPKEDKWPPTGDAKENVKRMVTSSDLFSQLPRQAPPRPSLTLPGRFLRPLLGASDVRNGLRTIRRQPGIIPCRSVSVRVWGGAFVVMWEGGEKDLGQRVYFAPINTQRVSFAPLSTQRVNLPPSPLAGSVNPTRRFLQRPPDDRLETTLFNKPCRFVTNLFEALNWLNEVWGKMAGQELRPSIHPSTHPPIHSHHALTLPFTGHAIAPVTRQFTPTSSNRATPTAGAKMIRCVACTRRVAVIRSLIGFQDRFFALTSVRMHLVHHDFGCL